MKVRNGKIFALILALAMIPGTFEFIENAVHLVTEGHMAHAEAAGDHHEPAGPEHGCTLTFHLCSCHASLAFLGSQSPPMIHLHTCELASSLAPDPPSTAFSPSIDRPPRA